MVEALLERLLALPAGPVYGLLGVLAATENIFPPVPADTAVALGAFLAGAGPLSVWIVFAVTWSANVASAAGVYFGARTAGRTFFRSRMGERLIRPAAMRRIEGLYARHGLWGIFVSRFIPGVRAVVPPFAGVAGLDPVRSLLPMAVASALWYGTLVWIGATAVRHAADLDRLVRGANVLGLAAGGLVLVAVAALVLVRRRRATPRGQPDEPTGDGR